MPSIGPSLPPDIGPSLPPQSGPSLLQSIGPTLPSGPSTEVDDDDDGDYGPSLPPHLVAQRKAGPGPTQSVPTKNRGPVQGPTLPSRAYDDDSDDDIGPQPLPPGLEAEEEDGVAEFIRKEKNRKKNTEESLVPKAMERQEWMLAPPSSSGLLASLDPKKLSKARHFSRSTTEKVTDNSLWTETPAEKLKRLSEEQSGKRRRATQGAEETDDDRKRRKVDKEIRRQIEEHNKSTRNASLVDMHASNTPAASTSSNHHPSKEDVIWDRDRDMGLGGKLMDSAQRNKLIKDAKGLGERFGAGKRGGYLD